jgi:zinc protease
VRALAGLFGLLLLGCAHGSSSTAPALPPAQIGTAPPLSPTLTASAANESSPSRAPAPDAPFRAEAPAVSPPRSFEMPAAQSWTLANGLRILLVEDPDAFSVSASVVVRTPTTSPALGAAIRNVTCGSKNWSAPTRLFGELSAAGAESSSASWAMAQEVTVTMPYFEARRGLRAFADMVVAPELEAACVDRRQRSEEALSRTTPRSESATAWRVIEALRAERAGKESFEGTPGELATLTRDDLADAYARAMRPAMATLVVVGHVTKADLSEMTATLGAPWPGPPGPRRAAPLAARHGIVGDAPVIADVPGASKASVLVAIPAVRWVSADRQAALVATGILGNGLDGRLKHQLRDVLGTTWSFRSTFYDDGAAGWLMFQFEAPNGALSTAVPAFLDQLRAFAASGPTDAEVDASKRSAVARLAASMETPSTLRSQLDATARHGLPVSDFRDAPRQLLAVSPADVRRVAARLSLDHARVVVVGDRNVTEGVTRRALGREVEVRSGDGARVTSP